MNVRDNFRNSVFKNTTADFKNSVLYTFQTVFHKSAYSYCCCPCAFDHEFFLYLEDGQINDEIYRRTETSVVNGRCPHVNQVPKEWLEDSWVSNAHIAVAADNREIDPVLLHMAQDFETGIFNLKLSNVVLAKYKTIAARYFWLFHVQNYHVNFFLDPGFKIHDKLVCRRNYEHPDHITVKYSSYLDHCIQAKNEARISHVLRNTFYTKSQFKQAMHFTMKENLNELQKVFLDRIKTGESEMIEDFVCSAVMYNQTDILSTVLDMADTNCKTKQKDNEGAQRLNFGRDLLKKVSKLCIILNKQSCIGILTDKNVLQESNLSNKDEISELLFSLRRYCTDFRDEIVAALKIRTNVKEECRNYLDRNLISIAQIPHVIKGVLALAGDITDGVQPENSLLLRILQRLNMYNSDVRETIKLLIDVNPDMSLQHNVIQLAIAQDEFMYKTMQSSGSMNAVSISVTGTYKTDAKEHGLFGYDEEDFALNFAAPFLLECGLPFERSFLEDTVSKNLHSAEINYIQVYVDNPKSLKVSCRDTLRKNFKGLKLHKFLENTRCPQKIKDFILMEYILKPTVFQGSSQYFYQNRY